MGLNLKLIKSSNYIRYHFILGKNLKIKVEYLSILEHFVKKYSRKDKFALEILNIYKNIILGSDMNQHVDYFKQDKSILDKDINKVLKKRIISKYKYNIICDCLYMNALLDNIKAENIVSEFKSIYGKRYVKNFNLIFNICYKNYSIKTINSIKSFNKIKYPLICLKNNIMYLNEKQTTILTTANMSAGKSTLINTLVGKNINRTMNDSCTSKVHYIYDKAFEDDFNYKLDGILNLNADKDALLNDDIRNRDKRIFVGTYFKSLIKNKRGLCVIDTPGVNSSLDINHYKFTKDIILNDEYDKMLYLLNAENCGTYDDLKYLNFIHDNVDENKIIFILNKLDSFRSLEDSIEKSIKDLKKELLKIGFKNPIIFPVSAYAGNLGKKKLFGEQLSENEEDDYIFLKNKFKKPEYNLSRFYPKNILNIINENYYEKSSNIDFLIKCGMLCLEEIIIGGEK